MNAASCDLKYNRTGRCERDSGQRHTNRGMQYRRYKKNNTNDDEYRCALAHSEASCWARRSRPLPSIPHISLASDKRGESRRSL